MATSSPQQPSIASASSQSTSPASQAVLANTSLAKFSELLGSRESVPGGGAAAAYVASLAAALAEMVVNFTVGKPRYADFEQTNRNILVHAHELAAQMLTQVDADAQAFTAVSQAWSLPQDAPERPTALIEAAKAGCAPALTILRTMPGLASDLEELVRTGSKLLISDVGCAATFARSAVEAASLNVFINTRTCTDTIWAESTNAEVEALTANLVSRLTFVYDSVAQQLKRTH